MGIDGESGGGVTGGVGTINSGEAKSKLVAGIAAVTGDDHGSKVGRSP
jgi:hypothetical protein